MTTPYNYREVLERDLTPRLRRYVAERADRYVVERALIELGLRSTMTSIAERQVAKPERATVNRRVRDALLAGGWPGHLQELVDKLEDAPAPVVPIAAAPSSTATGRPPRVPGPPPGPPGGGMAA